MPDDRRDDWRHGVDEHLVSLTAAQKVTDRELADIERLLTKLDRVISGDPQEQLEGLVEQIHNLNREVSKLNAVIFVDSTGKKGMLKTVEDLAEGREDRRVNWGNLTKIVVAVIMSGLLTHLWLEAMNAKTTDPLDKMIENAKHPKPRHRHYTIKEPSESSEETSQKQP